MNSLKLFTDRLFAPILAKPERGLWLLMALQFIAWAVIPYWYDDDGDTPSIDIIGHSAFMHNTFIAGGDIFAFHHPPLTMLITHWLNFGQGFLYFPHLVASQIFVCVTFYLVYLLGIELFKNKKQALAAVFLLILIKFFGSYTINFNHNIVLMPFWAGLILIFYRATRPLTQKANQHFYWLLFGVVAGIATFTKLTIGILLLTMIFWMLWDKTARAHLTTKSPYMGAAIALLVMSIHFYLAFFDGEGNFRLNYLAGVVGVRNLEDYNFLVFLLYDLQKRLVVFFIFIGIISAIIFSRPATASLDGQAKNFALFFAFAPLVLTLIVSFILHQPLLTGWLNIMFCLWGVAFITLIYGKWQDIIFKLTVASCCLFILVYPILSYPINKGHHGYSHTLASAVAKKIDQSFFDEKHDVTPQIITSAYDRNMVTAALLVPTVLSIHTFFSSFDIDGKHDALFIYQEESIPRIKERLASARDQKAFDQLTAQAHIFTFENKYDTNNPHRVGFVLIPPKQ